MSNNKKSNDDDYTDRVNKLLGKDTKKPTDEELAQRFTKVFSSEPISNQSYHLPTNVYNDDIDKEIEKMLQESDDEDDALDEYIYGVLKEDGIKDKMNGFQEIFTGSSDKGLDDESHELIKRIQQENALDLKYEQFTKSRDNNFEERYNALKKDNPTFLSTSDRPKGTVPKPLLNEELHDEMDDWCCICNEDASIECEGCDEEDNKYCKECFFHTHKSEFADYEATRHKHKRYQKRS